MKCIPTEFKKWWRTRAITAMTSCLAWLRWKCGPISLSPIVARVTGMARRRRRLRSTAIGDGFTGIVARVCSGSVEKRIERNFAHQFDTGGLDRLYVRGKENVHKKFLIQAAACNLALLMRSTYGSGKPRAAHDAVIDAILTILAVMRAVEDHFPAWSVDFDEEVRVFRRSDRCSQLFCRPKKWPV